ncbi:MAG: AcrR family transcriptional regulator [Glaciecola sp.]|jgi:AcrR family transcriptional regulator
MVWFLAWTALGADETGARPMRRHGWSGSPPDNDDEARQRILDAAMRCVDRQGAMQTSLSDVAADLGITRQTVYRYYPSTDELFSALAQIAADDFITRIVARMDGTEDPTAAMVEGLAFTVESVPDERYLALLLRSGDAFTKGIISEVAMDFGRSLLDRTTIDWASLGYDADELDGLVEFMLRLIQSLALTPIAPNGQPRTGKQMRAFLARWLGPAITTARPKG